MPFHKKVFGFVGNVFKYIGRQIRSGFNKLGRFMNKFGILGQIGMMWITGGIGSAMFSGLSSLGTGFMQGLAAGGTMSQTAHSILQGVSKLAKIPGNLVGSTIKETWGTITSAVVGTVQDTYSYLSNKLPSSWKFGGDPHKLQSLGEFGDNVIGRLSERFGEATSEITRTTSEAWRDAKKFYGDIYDKSKEGIWKFTNPEFDYRKFEVPTGKLVKSVDAAGKPVLDSKGRPVMKQEMKAVTGRDIAYSEKNLREFKGAEMRSMENLLETPKLQPVTGPPPIEQIADIKRAGEQAFKIESTMPPERGYLHRAGAEFTDELMDWFTSPGRYFGTAATSMAARSLQGPVRPSERMLAQEAGASKSLAYSASGQNIDIINAMINAQQESRTLQSQIPFDNSYADIKNDARETFGAFLGWQPNDWRGLG